MPVVEIRAKCRRLKPPERDKLSCCAIKDACGGRIVEYSINSRMKSRLAVQAPKNAVATVALAA